MNDDLGPKKQELLGLLQALLSNPPKAAEGGMQATRNQVFMAARQICQEVYPNASQDAEFLNLCGWFCSLSGNKEFATYCFHVSAALAPDNRDFAKNYADCLNVLKAERESLGLNAVDVAGYIGELDHADIMGVFQEKYQDAFTNGNLALAENWLNALVQFGEPFTPSFLPLGQCAQRTRDAREKDILKALEKQVIEAGQDIWSANTRDADYGQGDPNREKLAAEVAVAVGDMGKVGTVCFEVGAHTGTATEEVADALPGHCRLVALDPNADALATLKKSLPQVETVTGTVEDVVAGGVKIPDQIDVVFAFSAFCQIREAPAKAFFTRVAEQAAAVVVCEQILNAWGTETVIRADKLTRPVSFLHPYATWAKELGFKSAELSPVPGPERSVDGIVVAVK